MSKNRFVDDEVMLGNRDTGERRSDNLSIDRQEDETGRLKVQTNKETFVDTQGLSWISRFRC